MSGQNINPHEDGPILSGKVYAFLKPLATTILPALGAFYFAIAQIWGLPHATEVIGTIAAANAFLGVFVNASTRAYNRSDAKYDGTVEFTQDERQPDRKYMNVIPSRPPKQIKEQTQALFKVENKQVER